MDITRESVDSLINDALYLQDELEALKYVISTVPYSEKPAGQLSILEMIAMIKHGQSVFYRPAAENYSSAGRRVSKVDEDFKNSFNNEEFADIDVDHLINKIIKHRVSFVNYLKEVPINHWENTLSIRGQEKTLFKLIQEMITFERGQLKSVAERVLTMEDKSSQVNK